MPKFISKSDQETKSFAAKLAKDAKSHIFALTGELGAGKTTFVQGFAQGLGIQDKIISPTFVLIRQYQIPKSSKTLYHIDLYRLNDNTQVGRLGLEEIWSNPNHIVLIEWAEKYASLPKNTIKINIIKLETDQRMIITNK